MRNCESICPDKDGQARQLDIEKNKVAFYHPTNPRGTFMKLLTIIFFTTAFALPSWACDSEVPWGSDVCVESTAGQSSLGSGASASSGGHLKPTSVIQNEGKKDDIYYIQPVIDNEDPK
jgi:hypothetical protein